MIVVAKSIHKPANGFPDYVEPELPQFRDILARKGCFAYAWTFNPRQWAVQEISRELDRKRHLWLYLVGKPWSSPLAMRIVNFRHNSEPLPCPSEWIEYAPQYTPEQSYTDGWFKDWKKTGKSKPIHLWFLVDRIDEISPPEDLKRFACYFSERPEPPRYCEYKQGCFAFLTG